MKWYFTIFLLLPISVYSNPSTTTLGGYDSEYLSERLNAHTKTISSKNNLGEFPEGLLLQHVYIGILLEDEIKKDIKKSRHGENAGFKRLNIDSGNFVSTRAYEKMVAMCKKTKEQKLSNKKDVYSLALLAEQSEKIEYEDMLDYYSNKIKSLPSEKVVKVQEALNNPSQSLAFSRVSWSSLALELPDLVYALFDQGCSKID